MIHSYLMMALALCWATPSQGFGTTPPIEARRELRRGSDLLPSGRLPGRSWRQRARQRRQHVAADLESGGSKTAEWGEDTPPLLERSGAADKCTSKLKDVLATCNRLKDSCSASCKEARANCAGTIKIMKPAFGLDNGEGKTPVDITLPTGASPDTCKELTMTTLNDVNMEDLVPMTAYLPWPESGLNSNADDPKMVMAKYEMADGVQVNTFHGIREPRTRMAIHMHESGGQTCVLRGPPATVFVEGIPGYKEYPAGTCYYMPPGVYMTSANLGCEDQELLDVLHGDPFITVRLLRTCCV